MHDEDALVMRGVQNLTIWEQALCHGTERQTLIVGNGAGLLTSTSAWRALTLRHWGPTRMATTCDK